MLCCLNNIKLLLASLNTFLYLQYAFIVIVLLLAELACGIFLLVSPSTAEDFLKTTMKDYFQTYDRDPVAAKSIDALQSDVSFKSIFADVPFLSIILNN